MMNNVKHLGYYLQKDLDPNPQTFNEETKDNYQLNMSLIAFINKNKRYLLQGKIKNYQEENKHSPIFSSTQLLENFVNNLKMDRGNKLRIFIRGGRLCDFIMGTGAPDKHVIEFEYEEETNILRLFKSGYHETGKTLPASLIGEARLTGNTDNIIHVGRNHVYKVMQYITDEYELYYSKEVDGFDDKGEPVEIRSIIEGKCLNKNKILFRSCGLAQITKIVAFHLDRDDCDYRTICRVSIIDNYRLYQNGQNPEKILFEEVGSFFGNFLEIMKHIKSGTIAKAPGGVIVVPTGGDAPASVGAVVASAEYSLKKELKDVTNFECEIMSTVPQSCQHKKKILCAASAETLWNVLQHLDPKTIAACLIQYNHNPLQPDKSIDYNEVQRRWRKTVLKINDKLMGKVHLERQNGATKPKEKKETADLYLVGKNMTIPGNWVNTNDVQLLEGFECLDPNRLNRGVVVLFSQDERERAFAKQLFATHTVIETNELYLKFATHTVIETNELCLKFDQLKLETNNPAEERTKKRKISRNALDNNRKVPRKERPWDELLSELPNDSEYQISRNSVDRRKVPRKPKEILSDPDSGDVSPRSSDGYDVFESLGDY